jgi:hypothetical protein
LHSQRTQPAAEGQELAVVERMLHNPHRLHSFASIAVAAPAELMAAILGTGAAHTQLVEHMQKWSIAPARCLLL